MANIAVIGHGLIGKQIVSQAPRYGHSVGLVVTSKGIFDRGGVIRTLSFNGESPSEIMDAVLPHCRKLGIKNLMLAIPSSGDGSVEATYLTRFLAANDENTAITAGKSAVANQSDAIRDYMGRIGFSATVGGGAMILPFLGTHLYVDKDHPAVVTGVLNGTMNFALTRIADGASLDQICSEAIRLGFAEPSQSGALTMYDMLTGEMADISRKIAIICNTFLQPLTGRSVNQDDFGASELKPRDFHRVTADNSIYRYVVRISTTAEGLGSFNTIDISGRISTQIKDVHVAAGFVRVEGALASWVPDSVDNACHLSQNGDAVSCRGQGAGPVPTVCSMYADLRHQLTR